MAREPLNTKRQASTQFREDDSSRTCFCPMTRMTRFSAAAAVMQHFLNLIGQSVGRSNHFGAYLELWPRTVTSWALGAQARRYNYHNRGGTRLS